MAAKVARKGDLNNMKGAILNGSNDVLTEKLKTAHKGSYVKPHPKPGKGLHPINPIAQNTAKTVLVNGKEMAGKGSIDSCRHVTAFSCAATVLVKLG